jgi:K+-sensing histidine kinase KdpD
MQAQFPVLFFIFNTTIISYKLGWKPATMSAIIGIILAYYFFIPPFNSFELPTMFDVLNLFIYSLLFFTVIYLIEKLQRERFRAVLIARVSDSRMQIMAKLSSKK